MPRIGVWIMLLSMVLGWTGSAAASHRGWIFGAGGARMTITISEFKFSPATVTLEAGTPVEIVLDNKGILGHVFMVFTKPKTPLPASATERWQYVLAHTYLKDAGLDGEIMVHQRDNFAVAGTSISEISVDPGKKVTLTFVPAKKGTFEFACLISAGNVDHYKSGMKGTLIVK